MAHPGKSDGRERAGKACREMKKLVVFLVGPTAAGKSAVALALARKLKAEIISCDSMQIYKGIDILTAKPTVPHLKMVKHHLVSVLSPTQDYNVARFRKAAVRKMNSILRRRKIPLFVGGTGLYISALVDGIFSLKPASRSLRLGLYRLAREKGSGYLYARLTEVDPEAAARIHPNDTKRIIRCLEVYKTAGEPISKLRKKRRGLADRYTVRIFCLTLPRQELYLRIDRRVEDMFKEGLLEEVRRLLKRGLGKTASFAIGIKEIKGFLEGAYDLEEAKRLIKRNTRHYAKRQLTWFRKDPRIEWIKAARGEPATVIAEKIIERVNQD